MPLPIPKFKLKQSVFYIKHTMPFLKDDLYSIKKGKVTQIWFAQDGVVYGIENKHGDIKETEIFDTKDEAENALSEILESLKQIK
jgi:hypothetical protein